MIPTKSLYEKIMQELEAEHKVRVFTEEQNIQVMEELNEGMEDFLIHQKVNEKEAELELAGIILNA